MIKKDIIVYIIFGEMGSGKSYYGKELSLHKNIGFLEGDDLLTEDVAAKIAKFKIIPEVDINYYVYNILTPEIIKRATTTLVVSQALYLDKHRRYIRSILENHGLIVRFRLIKTPFFRNIKQLLSRKNGVRWVIYWLLNKLWFQKPTHHYLEINTDE